MPLAGEQRSKIGGGPEGPGGAGSHQMHSPGGVVGRQQREQLTHVGAGRQPLGQFALIEWIGAGEQDRFQQPQQATIGLFRPDHDCSGRPFGFR